MGADVLVLPGVIPSDARLVPPNAKLIARLERVLERARTGELRSMVMVGEDGQGRIFVAYELSEACHHHIIAALDVERTRLVNGIIQNCYVHESPERA